MADKKPATLAEALSDPSAGKESSPCKLMRIRDQLDPDDQVALDKAILNVREDKNPAKSKVYTIAWLSRVLRTFGHSISDNSIRRHLIGDCGCE